MKIFAFSLSGEVMCTCCLYLWLKDRHNFSLMSEKVEGFFTCKFRDSWLCGPRLKSETGGKDRSSSTESQVVVTWVVEAGGWGDYLRESGNSLERQTFGLKDWAPWRWKGEGLEKVRGRSRILFQQGPFFLGQLHPPVLSWHSKPPRCSLKAHRCCPSVMPCPGQT